jgi:hypothetical protein
MLLLRYSLLLLVDLLEAFYLNTSHTFPPGLILGYKEE